MQYTSKFSGEEIDSILDSVRDKQDAIPDLETIRNNAKNASDTIARMVESGYLFAGIATIDTNPRIPDAKVFYIANGKGTYEKFGGLEVTEDDVVILYWDTAWHKVSTGIASQAKLSELDQKVETFYEVVDVKGSNNLLDLAKITDNKKIDSSNGIIHNGSGYSVSDYIEVEASTYLFNTGRVTTSPIRKAAVYDENKNFLEIIDSGALTDRVTISNESAKYIILQFGMVALNAAIAVDGHVQFTKGTSIIPYEEYREPFSYTKPRIKPNMISSIVNGILKVEKSTLGNGEELALDDFPQCNKKNDRFSFFAKITTFEGLTFKVGDSGSLSGWVTITPTDIECYQGQTPDTPKSTFAHGLTINKYISVQIKVLNNGTLSVRVMTENGDKIITYNYWSYNIYRVKRWVSNSTLYDVVATATNKDYTCPIWVFGASYETINADDTSAGNKNRWIDHVRDFGFFNYLVNARGGRNSEETYADLLKALKFGTPRYLLWTMFGNDATAEELSRYIEKVKELAIDKGFEVILTKRPSTPTLDNSEKINVIVNSGCRYIDYERVLIESGNNWYAGYLSSDGVHPTVLGAKAIASSVLTDFIEITQY